MCQNADGYDAYPAEINSIIEQAYRKSSRIAEWEEEDLGRYVIDFSTMIEQKIGDMSSGVKVKRVTPGETCLTLYCNSVYSRSFAVFCTMYR